MSYITAIGGGAVIVDKYLRAVEEAPVVRYGTGDSSTAELGLEVAETTTAGQCRPAVIGVKCAA